MNQDARNGATVGRNGVDLMPPGWELLDWSRNCGVITIEARRTDGHSATVRLDTFPTTYQADPLLWVRQTIDLELLWAIS